MGRLSFPPTRQGTQSSTLFRRVGGTLARRGADLSSKRVTGIVIAVVLIIVILIVVQADSISIGVLRAG